MSEGEGIKEGWMWVIGTKKWHYFVQPSIMSLCGRWMARPMDLEQGNDDSPDNCAACRKALSKRKATTHKVEES